MNRKQARELLMQMIFQAEAQRDFTDAPLKMQMEGRDIDEEQKKYIIRTYRDWLLHRETIDQKLSGASRNWRLNRFPKAELAIARVGATEILYRDDIPDAVAVNEAVEMAKIYGEPKAGGFINGLLGRIVSDKADDGAGGGSGETKEVKGESR